MLDPMPTPITLDRLTCETRWISNCFSKLSSVFNKTHTLLKPQMICQAHTKTACTPPISVIHASSADNPALLNTIHSVQEGVTDYARLGTKPGQLAETKEGALLGSSLGSPNGTEFGSMLGSSSGLQLSSAKGRMLGTLPGSEAGATLGSTVGLHLGPHLVEKISSPNGLTLCTKPGNMFGSTSGSLDGPEQGPSLGQSVHSFLLFMPILPPILLF